MKTFMKAMIIVLSLCILLFAITQIASSKTQTVLNEQVYLTYVMEKKESLHDWYHRVDEQWVLKKRLDATNMSAKEKKNCLEHPEEYYIVSFQLLIQNQSHYWIQIKPMLKDTKHIRFVKQHLERLAGDNSSAVHCQPNDNEDWHFEAIVKGDQFEDEISLNNFRSMAFVKISGGPYIAMYFPKSDLIYSDEWVA